MKPSLVRLVGLPRELTVVSEVQMGGLYVVSQVVFLRALKLTVIAPVAQAWTQTQHLGT